jgi:hypothetical protein
MKLAVSYDDEGNIRALFNPEGMSSDRWSLKYVPAEGETHDVLDVPSEFESIPFEDLPRMFRINATGAQPHFERKA